MVFQSFSQFMIMYLVVLIFYVPVLYIVFQRKRQRRAVGEFYQGVSSVLEQTREISESIELIGILYKKISEHYSYVSDNFRSTTDMMEELLYRLESYSPERFKENYKIIFTTAHIERIVLIIREMKQRQPFSTLNSKHGNLLNLLKTSIDNSNQDLASSTLSQLSDEIEILEGTIRSQSRRNQISLIVSAVGVILTFVFGIITIVQAIHPLTKP